MSLEQHEASETHELVEPKKMTNKTNQSTFLQVEVVEDHITWRYIQNKYFQNYSKKSTKQGNDTDA